MNITSLTPAQLRKAATLKEQIEKLQKQLAQMGGSEAPAGRKNSPAAHKVVKTRKKISAAGIARIRAAQKARWAKIKAKVPKAPAKKARRKLSAEARAKMATAAKARWAKIKAAKEK